MHEPDAKTQKESGDLHCSFCNKSQRDVRKLIAGPTVFICDECVDVCNGILEESHIPAGRGAKAGLRSASVAEEYLAMASDLARASNQLGAAREIRNAALAALRGMAFVSGDEPSNWSETKVIVTALGDAEVANLLQVQDTGHVILRVSVDGAVVTSVETQNAMTVAFSLIALLREKAKSAMQQRSKPAAGG